MLSTKDWSIVYETVLSSPGMNEQRKIMIQRSCKLMLLLAQVVEVGLNAKEENTGTLLSVVDKSTKDELRELVKELLEKTGLTEMNEKLAALSSTK